MEKTVFILTEPVLEVIMPLMWERNLWIIRGRLFLFSTKREDTLIAGVSMGGFGAIHTGFMFPDTFGKIYAMSPALIIHKIAGRQENYMDNGGNYEYYRQVFGNLDKLLESDNNPEQLVLKLLAAKRDMPALYFVCGTEDELYPANRQFYSFLKEHQVNALFHENEGDHNYDYWNKEIESGIMWLVAE